MKYVGYVVVIMFGVVSPDKYLDCGPNWKQNFCRIRNTTEANANEMLHFSQYPKKNLSLVEKIVFDKETVNQMTPTMLENLPNLEEIRAKNCHLKQIDKALFGTNQGKKLPQLKTLTLSKNSLTKLEDMMFARANEMESLYLVRNKIGTIEKNAFRGLKKLSTLDLSHNYLKKLTYTDMFPDSEQMFRLDFSHNHLQEVDFDVFANNQRYQAIKLNNNNIDKVRASEDMLNIGLLDLSFNSLMNATALERMKNLISFKADHNYNASLVSTVNFIEEAIAMQSLKYYNIFTQV
jgi:Leucine-rich repeat (LRR) protein